MAIKPSTKNNNTNSPMTITVHCNATLCKRHRVKLVRIFFRRTSLFRLAYFTDLLLSYKCYPRAYDKRPGRLVHIALSRGKVRPLSRERQNIRPNPLGELRQPSSGHLSALQSELCKLWVYGECVWFLDGCVWFLDKDKGIGSRPRPHLFRILVRLPFVPSLLFVVVFSVSLEKN